MANTYAISFYNKETGLFEIDLSTSFTADNIFEAQVLAEDLVSLHGHVDYIVTPSAKFLYAEWIDYMKSYMLFQADSPQKNSCIYIRF